MDLASGLGVVALLTAVAQLDRKGAVQAMLSRPLVLATALGWALGDLSAGLMLAVPLELFWLGSINVGAHLPDHEVVGTSAVTGGVLLAAAGTPVSPTLAVTGLLLLAPFSIAGRLLGQSIERANIRLTDRVEQRVREVADPMATNLLGLLTPLASAVVLSVAGALLGSILLPWVLYTLPDSICSLGGAAWAGVVAAAGAVGLSNLRSRRAPWVALVGTAVGAALWLAIFLSAGGLS